MSSLPYLHEPIVDISGGKINQYLKKRVKSSLIDAYHKAETPYLPEEFLYLNNGLHIWRDLVYNPKYYQTHDEINLFRKNGEQIASYIPDNCILIDLGSGNLAKVETLLSILENSNRPIVYLAVDINRSYLDYDIPSISQRHHNVTCHGLFGTFTDALSWCREHLPASSPKAFLSFGSSFFRGTFAEALAALQSWKELMHPGDLMIVGADGHSEPEHHGKIWEMYHADEEGWQRLWDNGFGCANEVVGEEWFRGEDWKLDAVIETTAAAGGKSVCQHRFRFRARRDVELGSSGVRFREGGEMGWLDAHKFRKELVYELCRLAGLEVVEAWQAEGSEMYQYLITLKGECGRANGSANGVHDGVSTEG